MSSPALPGVVDAGPAVPVSAASVGGWTARWRWLAVYFGAWAAIALMYLVVQGTGKGLGAIFGYTAMSWSVRALAMLPALWLARRLPFRAGGWLVALLVHLPASIGCGVAKSAASVSAAQWLDCLEDLEFDSYLRGDLPFNILSYWGVVAVVTAVQYHARFREREMAAARLQAELAQAQLDALKLQLHPHFLFNTLHSISALIHEDPESADLMVSRLSDFLRLVLQNVSAHELPLREELDFVDRYLQIQHTRFGGRLRTRVEVEPGALDAAVPNLLLQPLVENAIRHAVEPREDGGRVEIRAARVDGALRIQVRDDGAGLPAEQRAGGFGLGLANTRSRLAHLYGERHRLTLENAPGGGLVVTVELPFVAAAAVEAAR